MWTTTQNPTWLIHNCRIKKVTAHFIFTFSQKISQMSVIRPSPIPTPRCRSQTVYRRLHSIHFIHHHRRRRWNPRSEAEDTATARSPEAAGGKMVVELVGAFNEVTERMNSVWLSTSSSRLLFKALKLSIPILQSLPLASDGRSPLSKALSLSILLADLQVPPLSELPRVYLGLDVRIPFGIGSGFYVRSSSSNNISCFKQILYYSI